MITQTNWDELAAMPVNTKQILIEALRLAIQNAINHKQRQRFKAALLVLEAEQQELPF